ncbi:heparinase II/III family protein [Paenibacillus thailandensis]|uniref:Heparinase II/III family protein n=1 Tax=Paenibacillus thailandensis TaxID=393250 RepID=A0ABW5QVU3_9BACL
MVSEEELKRKLERLAPAGRGMYDREGGQERFWRTVRESEDYADIVGEIRREGKRLGGTPVPELTYGLFTLFEKRGTRLEYENAYFERRRRLNTYMLLALLEPEKEERLKRLYDMIWSVCGEYTWCLPAHIRTAEARGAIDLFAAETGFTLCEMRRLLGDRLPALLRDRIAQEVEERLLRPYMEAGPFGWETARHNWSAVCAGSIGAAALLLLEPSERLTAIVLKALGSMACFLEGYGDDGACLEGVGYWNYGFGYFVYFADLLKRRTEGGIDLFAHPKVRAIALFQQKCYLHGAAVANFSDSAARVPAQLGLSHYLAGLYEEFDLPPSSIRASYTDDHCSRWAPAFRNIVWCDPAKRADTWRDADYVLPDAKWVMSRHTSSCGSFGFAAKGGHNDEPHNHNDIGSFIVSAEGVQLVAELGAGEYTAAYFGDGRYGFDCNGSQGHSVPIVDGAYQAAGPDSKGEVLEASARDGEVRLKLEMASAYRLPHLSSLVRELVWRKRELPSLRLTDEFAFTAQPGSIVERIVTLCAPVVLEGPGGPEGGAGRTAGVRFADSPGTMDNARVEDSARTAGIPRIMNNACVEDSARIADNSGTMDNARIADNPGIDDARTVVTLDNTDPAGGGSATGFGTEKGRAGSLLLRGEGSGDAALIRYDAERLKPHITKRTYSNHYGRETDWYTVDFELTKPERKSRVELEFELISTERGAD